MTRSAIWLALPLVAACGGSPSSDAPQPSSSGAGSMGGTGSSTGGNTAAADPMATPCEATADCESPGVCAASYDPGLRQPGPAVCVAECIDAEDITRWCVDDQGCCDEGVCNLVDGFCVNAEAETTTIGSSGSGSSGDSSGTGGSSTSGDADTEGMTTSGTAGTTSGSSTGGR